METYIAKYKSHSSKVLQKLAKVKTGDELEAINSILASRGALQEHPAENGTVVNTTETEEYKAENGITEADEDAAKAAFEADRKGEKLAKILKELKTPKALKKEITDDQAKANLATALANKGRQCTFLCTKTKEMTEGVIVTARLDKRNNFVQYRIKTADGAEWGKGFDSKDITIGDMAPVVEKPKAEPKVEAEAPKAEKKGKKAKAPVAEAPVEVEAEVPVEAEAETPATAE